MAQRTLLELDTEAPERAVIKIDGVSYEMRSRDDLGLKEDAEFRRMMKSFSDSQPGEDWEKMAKLLEEMVTSIVIGLPLTVNVNLSDAKKLKIIEAFTKEVSSPQPTSKSPVGAGA